MEKEPLDSLGQWGIRTLFICKKICNWDKKRSILTTILFFGAVSTRLFHFLAGIHKSCA